MAVRSGFLSGTISAREWVRALAVFARAAGTLVVRDLRMRVAGSALGLVWMVFHPLSLMLVYTLVFGLILRVRFNPGGSPWHFAVYLLSGLLPWLAFQEGVMRATTALVDNAHLVKQVRFPLVALLVTPVASALAILLVTLSLFYGVLGALGMLHAAGLLAVGAALVVQTALALGLALWCATLHAYVRDTVHVVSFMMMLWFFITPILYPLDYVPATVRPLLVLNPLTGLVGAYRAPLDAASFSAWGFLYATLVGLAAALGGYRTFARRRSALPDLL